MHKIDFTNENWLRDSQAMHDAINQGNRMNRLADYWPETNERLTPEQTQSLWLVATWRRIAMEWRRRAEKWEMLFWILASFNLVALIFGVYLAFGV